MLSLARTSARQREIIEVLLRSGWGYMRQLLSGENSERPTLPPPQILRKIFVELGPVWIKVGQLLSTRPDLLGAEYLAALETLQARVPPVPWCEVEAVFKAELDRPWNEIFESIEQEPVAAGSIAQTHRATLKSGRQVAVKVQRPGIENVVRQDIALIRAVADLVARTEFGKQYDIRALAEEFVVALEAELDFTREARHTTELRTNLSASPWFDSEKIMVPQVEWELTTRRIMVMEWLTGGPILTMTMRSEREGGGKSREERKQITTVLFRAFFQQIFIDGIFHADPHPGNIFYLEDGRVALLDCGMVGRFDPITQQHLTEFILSIISMDAARCAQLTLHIAEPLQPVDLLKLESDYSRLLRKHYTKNLSDMNFSGVVSDLLHAARDNRIRVPGSLGLYAKALANLEGVARKFYPEVNLVDEIRPLMTDLFKRQLLGEDPQLLMLRTLLDVRNLTLNWPRRFEVLLEQMSSQTFHWNVSLRGTEKVRRSLVNASNRLSFAIVVGALIVGAAILSSSGQGIVLSEASSVMFVVASLLGFMLIVSIVRSGRGKG